MRNTHLRVKTLSEQVRWQLLWLGFGLILACLLTLFFFALRGTTLTTDSLMQLEAESLLRQITEQPDLSLPRSKTFSAYQHWEAIPESLRQLFADTPIDTEKSIEVTVSGADGEKDYIYLMHHKDETDGEIFLLSRYTTAEVEAVSLAFFKTALSQSLWLTLIIFVLLYFLVRWLIRRTTEPLALLSQWAFDLGKHPNQSLKVNFPIEELNQIAAQLHQGVGRIQAYNEREQQFLKHASHELRTPLAIVQASLDTLNLQSESAENPVVQRALRASANMRRLSTALLWLARESERPIDKSEIRVSELCNQIIDDHRYLLSNRDVDIRLNINVDTLKIEADLFAIVIANLVRNAFQYSTDGAIELQIAGNGLVISNSIDRKANDDTAGSSFGLGLQLVQRICQKLQWQFSFDKTETTVLVIIDWSAIK
jgi:signal transduction histidine kinase